jgi:hypothetical protein
MSVKSLLDTTRAGTQLPVPRRETPNNWVIAVSR